MPTDVTLQLLVAQHILTSGRRSFLVQRDAAALGLLTLHHVIQIPRAQWGATTLRREDILSFLRAARQLRGRA